MDIRYQNRLNQRHLYAKAGEVTWIVGATIFGISAVLGLTVVELSRILVPLRLGMFAFPFGGVFTMIFGRVGWTRIALVDFFLNQLSVLIAAGGFVAVLIGGVIVPSDRGLLIGIAVIVIGVSLALIGIKFHSPPRMEPD